MIFSSWKLWGNLLSLKRDQFIVWVTVFCRKEPLNLWSRHAAKYATLSYWTNWWKEERWIGISQNAECLLVWNKTRLRNVSQTESGTVVSSVGTGPWIIILFSWIWWPSSPGLPSYVCSKSSKPRRSKRLTTLKSKISSMSTIETRLFWPYSNIPLKVVNRNTRCMCIIIVHNIIWRPGHAIRSSSLLDFTFLHHSCRRVFILF